MGGMLLSKIWSLPVKRLSNSEYNVLGERLSRAVVTFAPDRKFRPLRHFYDKQDHGDFDGLLETKAGDSYNWIEFLGELSDYAPHKNGTTISVPIDGFQCDFNLAESACYECSYDYHSFECGMLVGVVARRLGLQYASAGLHLMVPRNCLQLDLPAHEFENILISVDTQEIFGILGFDYERFVRGFNNREDMYEWVVRSKYFIGDYFQYTELNHQNKMRNAKRPTYAAFLEWAANKSNNEEAPSKESVRERFAKVTHVAAKIEVIKAGLSKNAERRAKFNGEIVMGLRGGITGKDLGAFIVSFKSRHPDFERWLDGNTAEEVKWAIVFH